MRGVAAELQAPGLATVLADLQTPAEERRDAWTAELRFNTSWASVHSAAGCCGTDTTHVRHLWQAAQI